MLSLRFCYNLMQRERTKSYLNRLLLDHSRASSASPPSLPPEWKDNGCFSFLLLVEQLQTGLHFLSLSSPGASTSLLLRNSFFASPSSLGRCLIFYFLSLLSSLFCFHLLVLSLDFLSLLGSNFAWTCTFSLSILFWVGASFSNHFNSPPFVFTPPSLSLQEFGPCSLLFVNIIVGKDEIMRLLCCIGYLWLRVFTGEKHSRKKMKYLSEIESLINAAITNKFNIFAKHEITYTFKIFTTITFTTV